MLPHFHGKPTEDLDNLLFKFNILCQSYDYISIEKKLKLCPATLKDNALRWFMSLGGEIVTTWDHMKQVFIVKYQKYCRTMDKREELFNMVQKYDESWEDIVERLLYNVHRSGQTTIGRDVLKIILLWGIREDCTGMLNILGKRHDSKESIYHIVDLCRWYSKGSSRINSRDRDIFSWEQKSHGGGASREKIGNILYNFKTDMMSYISSQQDFMREKHKQVVGDLVLGVFFPKCRKKHPLKEFPLDKVEVCGLCEFEHDTKDCPSLPKSKAIFQACTVDTE